MKRILSFLLVMGTSAMMLPSCQKEVQAPQLPTLSNVLPAGTNGYTAPGSVYQVELSANIPSLLGGGIWLWIGLNANGKGDYSGSDCGHGLGAVADQGDVTWHYTSNNTMIEIDGLVLNGLGGYVTTITIPSTYGHYTGTIGTYLTLPSFVPPNLGSSQLQVAP